MKSRTYDTYKVRYTKCEAILCAIMILVVAVSGFYIWSEGTKNRNTEITDDYTPPVGEELGVWIDLYSDVITDLSGSLTIKNLNGSVFQILTVDTFGIVIEDILPHAQGEYTISYIGTNNEIVFGPVSYNVQYVDSLLVDVVYFDIRITIRTR